MLLIIVSLFLIFLGAYMMYRGVQIFGIGWIFNYDALAFVGAGVAFLGLIIIVLTGIYGFK